MTNSARAALVLCLVALALLSRPHSVSAAVGPITVEVAAPTSAQAGAPVDLTVRATNLGNAVGRWSISVALPDGGKVALLSPRPFTSGRSYARVFNPGDSLFDFASGQSVPASYPLAELYRIQTWPRGAQRSLSVRVTPPADVATMRLFIRIAARDSTGRVVSSAQAGGDVDQQGLPVLVRAVPIAQAPPPPSQPTATPAPTQSPTPAPTPTPLATPTRTMPPTSPPVVGPVATPQPTAARPAPTPTPIPTPTPSAEGWNPVLNMLLTLGALAAIAGVVTLFTAWRSRRSPAPVSWGRERTAVDPVRVAEPAAPGAVAPRPRTRSLEETAPLTPVPPDGASAGAQTLAFVPLPTFPPGLTPTGEVKHGGMADVYRAYQSALDRDVALKIPRPGLAADAGFAQRFRDEARRTARLRHPNIITVYDVGEAAGVPYISMRYVDGPALSEVLEAGRRIAPRRALRILDQVALALDYAHSQGVVHGDVKPSNVLLEGDDHATLTDFGVASVVGTGAATQGTAFGTPDYISPEQARGEPATPAADVYSLGVVAYELLVGRRPFNADDPLALVYAHAYSPPPPPDQLNPSLSEGAARVLLRALSKEPAGRYSTASELVAVLRRGLRS